MAARHATLECSGKDLSIRDLESPGGTFVNQQRLLSGQPRKLSPGDVIQLGGVQLKVKQDACAATPAVAAAPAATADSSRRGTATTAKPRGTRKPQPPTPAAGNDRDGRQSPPARPPCRCRARRSRRRGRLPTAFALASGAQCRTWDDFLVLSAQSWTQVRDELVSGRLAEYLRRIGRPELIPHSRPDRSPDDRLDEWLARLPATQSSAPELDVHPETLLVQAKMGGGVARLSLRVTNVGLPALAKHGPGRAGRGALGQAALPGKTAGRSRRSTRPRFRSSSSFRRRSTDCCVL